MYKVALTTRARKSLAKYARSGIFPQTKFRQAILCLEKGQSFPQTFKDHALKGYLDRYREFHLAQDLLVQYERDERLLLVTIYKIGTHTELFGK
jgi:mRNA interferase YafQ